MGRILYGRSSKAQSKLFDVKPEPPELCTDPIDTADPSGSSQSVK
jgi:hypothetical protein